MAEPSPFDQRRRALFSRSSQSYDRGRPGYPDEVYEILATRCGLGSGARVLEVGPGTGQATRDLVARGATVVAVELGAEFVSLLRDRFPAEQVRVETGAFEDVGPRLVAAGDRFDLVAAATSFHWVPTEVGLHLAADLLDPGAWLALWWTSFGDPSRPDPFHDALHPVLQRVAPSVVDSPSAAALGAAPSYAGDAAARIAEIDATGRFGPVHHEVVAWSGRHDALELRHLFASFSPWLALADDERAVALDAVEALAVEEFGGVVERPYLTPVYLAPRRP